MSIFIVRNTTKRIHRISAEKMYLFVIISRILLPLILMIHRRRERLVLLIYQLRLLCDNCDRMTNDLRNITSEYKDYRYEGMGRKWLWKFFKAIFSWSTQMKLFMLSDNERVFTREYFKLKSWIFNICIASDRNISSTSILVRVENWIDVVFFLLVSARF